jgi:hypothetical protein
MEIIAIIMMVTMAHPELENSTWIPNVFRELRTS